MDGRYNLTAERLIRKAYQHLRYAWSNLGYGILQSDFAEERKIIDAIADQIREKLEHQ